MRVWLNLRYTLPERVRIFTAGLKRLGYEVRPGLAMSPEPGDLFVTWNRIGQGHQAALRFEAAGLPVIVAENAAWGNSFAGRDWYTLARNYHNTAGMFPVGGSERWDSLGVELQPWRTSGETVILPQRGIGPPGVAMPRDWPAVKHSRIGGRIRHHPGRHAGRPLQDDLARCGRVVTWGSGAAIKALMWGIPVESDMPNWIAHQNNTDAGRLGMFRRLAHAQWRMDEIESGEAFRRLLQ